MRCLRRIPVVVAASVALSVIGALAPVPVLAQTWQTGVEQRSATPGQPITGVQEFSMIAVSWSGSSEVPPPVAVHGSDGWETLPADSPGPDAGPDDRTKEARDEVQRKFSEPTWVGGADGYRVDARPGVSSVTVHLIRDEQVLRPVVADEAAGAAPAPADGPSVNLRASWGAAPAKEANSVARSLKFAVIHHTAGTNDYSQADVPAILRGIQSFHQNSRGWNDIAYNFLIDKWGGIWEGRSGGIDKPIVGSHAANFNTGTVGISLIGDFSATDASAAAIESTVEVTSWKLALAGVRADGTTTVVGTADNVFPAGQTVTIPTIVGHRDIGQTDCPGRVWNLLGSIRAAAAQRRAPYVTGNLEQIELARQGVVRVSGWAYDRRSSDPVRIVVDVNGRPVANAATSVGRPDVQGPHPTAPAASGFSADIAATDESNEVCVYAAETSYGALTKLGCRTFNTPSNPRGNYESLTASTGGAIASGWALDPNTADPIDVQIYVDGAYALTARAELPRPDVGAVYPTLGASHGWKVGVPLPEGRHRVCAFAINVGPGSSNPLLDCRDIGGDPNPTGWVDGAVRAGNQAVIYGWALDRDTTGPIAVLFFVNDRMAWLANATIAWPGLNGVFPAYGTSHGFFTAMPLPKGTSNICAYALNVGPGNPATNIGCRVLSR